ncbi:MAG: triosephosphate isomerase, partial [Chlamydiia bacterium]|nr:triosephosphate isomerase [Chlamydiia bacterium]
ALSDGLQPLLCIGETLEEREGDKTEEVLRNQLTACLEGVTKDQAAQLIVAYEPVWAIGSNRSATPEMANETHALVRRILAEQFTDTIPILYGGSVNADNASALLQQPEIDGLLIGGASLSADHFAAIVQQQGEPVS